MRILPGYEDDWDVNLRVAEIGHVYVCWQKYQTDPEFMVEAIRLCPLNFAANELAREPSFIEHVLGRIPDLVDFIEKNFESFFLYSRCHLRPRFHLNMFPAWLRNRASFVKAAIIQDKYQLEYASKELLDDEDFILWVIAVNTWNRRLTISDLKMFSARLRDSKEFAVKAIGINDFVWWELSARLKSDIDVVTHGSKSAFKDK